MPPTLDQFNPFRLTALPVSLPWSGWYATPLSVDAAADLQAQARQARQRALAGQRDPFSAQLAELVAGYWLGRAIDLNYRSLSATAPHEYRGLVELIYGQLLTSRKLTGAHAYLQQGFRMAARQNRLTPADYLALLRRHELLRALVLTDLGSPPCTLPDLLNEARIIRQLQPPGGRCSFRHRDDDTLG